MESAELDRFASELFEHWRDGDLDFVEKAFAPEGVLRFPTLGISDTLASLRPRLESFVSRMGSHTHEDVRRTVVPPDLIVEQHVARSNGTGGREVSTDVCALIRLGDDGRIILMEEYFEGNRNQEDPRRQPIRAVQTHVDSEFTNDVDAIMKTVSERDVFFPLVHRNPDGSFEIDVRVDREGARRFYSESREVFSVRSSVNVLNVSSDWYTVRNSVGTVELREAGRSTGVKSSNNPTVVVFPVADDGIIGEILWSRHEPADAYEAARRGQPLPLDADRQREVDNVAVVKSFTSAWQRGELETIEELVTEECCWISKVVSRDYETESMETFAKRQDVLDHLRATPAPADLMVVNQLVTDWYAVLEYQFTLPDEEAQRRKVALYPLEGGKIVGELSYAIDEPSPLVTP